MDTRIQNIQSALSALRTANDAAARLSFAGKTTAAPEK